MNKYKELENISYINCPNCDENTFALEQNICLNCDYQHKIFKVTSQSSCNLEKNLNPVTKKIKLKYNNYESYEVEIFNNKILSIKFKYLALLDGREHKFILIIDYTLEHKVLKEISYQEIEKEEREKIYKIDKIKKIKIKKIAEKAKVGYKEFKYYPRYFGFLGIKEKQVKFFIEKVLKKFHNI